MQAEISKTFRFEAAHQLPNHDGKCRNPHGHSYKVTFYVKGNINIRADDPKEGMVIDFADIKEVWEDRIKPIVDHSNLNASLGSYPPTTAENIAVYFLRFMRECGVPITSCQVWETETSSARVEWSEVWANGG